MGHAFRFRAALLGLALAVSPALSGPAWAQDFGDLDEDEPADDEKADQPKPADDDGPIDDSEPDDDEFLVRPDADDGQELKFDDELESEIEEVKTRGPGEDTAKIYREALDEYARLGPDEEALAWERYMRKYPNSTFKSRIETRLDELNQELYDGKLDASYERTADAGKAEILFSQPLLLENIDPRSKLRAGFEWGIPNYINFFADYEQQLFREMSVHAGLRRRFTGWTIEAGTHYAIVKSARTNFLLTAIGDVRLNVGPAFPAIRPQLAMGKRFKFGGDFAIDLNVQGGSDIAFIKNEGGDMVFSPRAVGGANIMIIPTPTVRVYLESSTYMKGFGADQVGTFAFNQFSVGIRFVGRKSKTQERYDVGLGASVPYQQRYWGYHNGSVAADMNYFL